MKVMVVDDEPRILEGLERILRHRVPALEVKGYSGGRRAMDALAQERFDVVITDLRMPEVGGGEVLRHVRDGWPDTLRFALSAYIDNDCVAEADQAHGIFLKPCPSNVLAHALSQARTLRTLLATENVKTRMATWGVLPPLVVELRAALAGGRGAARIVLARLEEEAPAARARLVRLAGAALGQPNVAEVDLLRLKARTLQALVIVVGLLEHIKPTTSTLDLLSIERSLLRKTRAAVAVAKGAQEPVIASLMCDVGSLVIGSRDAADVDRLLARDEGDRQSCERQILGVSHADISGLLLALWGFPIAMANAARAHHAMGHDGDDRLAALTHIAACAAEGIRVDAAVVEPFLTDGPALITTALAAAAS
jgi:CheY-like chemotaxis protein